MAVGEHIVTVSTIRDTVPNVRRFVGRNLSSGIDHMIVFLDQDQPELVEVLGSDPHVTVVPTAGDDYWLGHRPPKVDDRRKVNANLLNAALTVIPAVRWLVHLDADEAPLFDRARLLACDARTVRFLTLEAVARQDRPEGDVREFKRVPTETELLALDRMGVIADPTPASYYRGHWAGKSATRPDLGVRISAHVPRDPGGNRLPSTEILPDSFLLHYESYCLEDFADRWSDFDLEKYQRSNHRVTRKRLGLAAYGIINHPSLSDDAKDRYLRRLFERKVADDVAALRRLGMIVEVPEVDVPPRPLPAAEVEALEDLLTALRPADKRAFLKDADEDAPVAELDRAAARLDRPALVERVHRTVAEHRATAEAG
jgi:hypothetical protein